jgi:hypothetical protein
MPGSISLGVNPRVGTSHYRDFSGVVRSYFWTRRRFSRRGAENAEEVCRHSERSSTTEESGFNLYTPPLREDSAGQILQSLRLPQDDMQSNIAASRQLASGLLECCDAQDHG